MSADTQAERAHDNTQEDSFPASDPPANSGITGAESPDKPPHERDVSELPTGLPTSDRHGAETAHQREHQIKPDSP
jgi:hypothetical protein